MAKRAAPVARAETAAKPATDQPFDLSLQNLLGDNPDDWRDLFGLDQGTRITSLPSTVSGMSLIADRLYKVGTGKAAYGLHAELESGHIGKSLPRRLLDYSVLAEARHKLVFRSVAVLLTKGANSPAISGRLERRLPDGKLIHVFLYDVIRVYDIPAAELLESGLSVVALAPLGTLTAGGLPGVVERMGERFKAEATDVKDLRRLWTASWLLMSARHSPSLAESLLKGAVESVLKLEDFPLYGYLQEKGLVEGRVEGRVEAAHELLLRAGAKRLGTPTDADRARVVAVSDYDRLGDLLDRTFEAASWEELLADA